MLLKKWYTGHCGFSAAAVHWMGWGLEAAVGSSSATASAARRPAIARLEAAALGLAADVLWLSPASQAALSTAQADVPGRIGGGSYTRSYCTV